MKGWLCEYTQQHVYILYPYSIIYICVQTKNFGSYENLDLLPKKKWVVDRAPPHLDPAHFSKMPQVTTQFSFSPTPRRIQADPKNKMTARNITQLPLDKKDDFSVPPFKPINMAEFYWKEPLVEKKSSFYRDCQNGLQRHLKDDIYRAACMDIWNDPSSSDDSESE